MKSFYSIVNISTNIATSDTIAIGVILFDGVSFRCYFSDKKKRLVNKMLDAKINIDFLLKQIAAKCEDFNSEKDSGKLLYTFTDFSEPSYFDYLGRYSNGLLQFSPPNIIGKTMDDQAFGNLILYLFKEETGIPQQVSNYRSSNEQIVEEKLIQKVQDKVHTHYKFTEEKFPSLFFNIDVDCIGLNGSLVGAKSIDFSKSAQTIDNNISHYMTLISNLSLKYNKDLPENNFFIIAEEPKEIQSREHKIWESVLNSQMLEVIAPDESGKVVEIIERKKASTFLE